jgi:thioredoxin reductase
MDKDAVIIGGGAAGLSAALVLGRARRQTVLFDDGAPSNAPAHAIGGLLGQAGTSPLELLEAGREQLAELPSVELRRETADSVSAGDEGVEVNGVAAETLLLAPGMNYAIPSLPGAEELWGDSVFHCPFCHGWEVQGQPLALLGDGDHAVAVAQLLTGWSDEVVLLTDPDALAGDDRDVLAAAGVEIDGRPVSSLKSREGKLEAVVFDDGDELPRAGLMVLADISPRTTVLEDLGLETDAVGRATVDYLGQASHPRVWAAGDIAEPAPSVAVAIAGGSRAASGIAKALLVAPGLSGANSS